MDFRKIQSDRLVQTRALASQYNAVNFMADVELNNPSAYLPYHNNQHNFAVACNAVYNGRLEGLPESQIRVLFIAGLYHDWDHTGTGNERVNIWQAANGALAAMKLANEPEDVRWDVLFLIQSTSTGYLPAARTSLAKKILHDADILQNLEPDYEVFLEGLALESGKPVTFESTKSFLNNHAWLTGWAEARFAQSVFKTN